MLHAIVQKPDRTPTKDLWLAVTFINSSGEKIEAPSESESLVFFVCVTICPRMKGTGSRDRIQFLLKNKRVVLGLTKNFYWFLNF